MRENGKEGNENLKRKEGKDRKREIQDDGAERSEIPALAITVRFPSALSLRNSEGRGLLGGRLGQTDWASSLQFVYTFKRVLSTKCLSLGRKSFSNKMPGVGYDTNSLAGRKYFFMSS